MASSLGSLNLEINSLEAVWTCVETDTSNCFTNQTWMALTVMPSRALMWRQFSQIDYRRTDGYIKASSPVDDLSPIPTAFDVHGLFQIYNLSYGLANLSDSSQFTDEIKSDI